MQFLRSSRGMLAIGAVLAIVAFVLVVVLLNQKSNNNSSNSTGTPLPTATLGVVQPSATPTVGLSFVQAVKDVPAGTKLTSDALVHAYFKDVAVPANQLVPVDVITSIATWETDTKVISGTNFIGTLLITTPIKHSAALRAGQFRALPTSPIGSLAYAVSAGRVAESIQLLPLFADNGLILPGDYVDLLLSIRQHEVDSLTSNPPSTTTSGAIETQELVSNAKVVTVAPGGIYTLELPIQDALLVKYVKDTSGIVDMVLLSSEDVKNQNAQPPTNPVVPEYFLTPQPAVKSAQGVSTSPTPTPVNGVPYPFATPRPTSTPVPPR